MLNCNQYCRETGRCLAEDIATQTVNYEAMLRMDDPNYQDTAQRLERPEFRQPVSDDLSNDVQNTVDGLVSPLSHVLDEDGVPTTQEVSNGDGVIVEPLLTCARHDQLGAFGVGASVSIDPSGLRELHPFLINADGDEIVVEGVADRRNHWFDRMVESDLVIARQVLDDLISNHPNLTSNFSDIFLRPEEPFANTEIFIRPAEDGRIRNDGDIYDCILEIREGWRAEPKGAAALEDVDSPESTIHSLEIGHRYRPADTSSEDSLDSVQEDADFISLGIKGTNLMGDIMLNTKAGVFAFIDVALSCANVEQTTDEFLARHMQAVREAGIIYEDTRDN